MQGFHFFIMVWTLMVVRGSSTPAILKFSGGKMDGIVIIIGDSVPSDSGWDLVKHLQELLTESSRILYRTTSGRIQFGHITIAFSESWAKRAGVAQERTAIHWRFDEAHIRVGESNPLHGHSVYTQQPKACGFPGVYIHITPDFLLDSAKENSALILVHNWLRFRYGVFPETGLQDHPQYPIRYTTEDKDLPTTCTNLPLRGEWRGHCDKFSEFNLYDSDCEFVAFSEQDEGMTSSIMTWPLFPQMVDVCNHSTHNPLAPTIHNALCRSTSVWDIMKGHEDFHGHESSSEPPEFKEPVFSLAKHETPKRFVLLLDSSANVNKTGRSWMVHSALEKLMEIYFPDETQVAVVTYTDLPHLHSTMTLLRDKRARQILRRLATGKPSIIDNASIVSAIQFVINEFFLEEGGVCLLISSGKEDPFLSTVVTNEIIETLLQQKVRLVSIVVGSEADQLQTTAQSLLSVARTSGGYGLVLSDKIDTATSLAELDSAMLAVAELIDTKIVVIDREARRMGHNSGSFLISDDAADNFRFCVTFVSNHRRERVHLTSPSQLVFNGTYEGYDDKKIPQEVSISIPFVESGNWFFHVDTDKPIVVTTTAMSTSNDVIRIRGWIQVKPTNKSAWPVVLFAEVLKGTRPITYAKVEAVVHGNSREQVLLLDLGSGDPDTFKKDGIYSRYIPGLLKRGYYNVYIKASDGGQAHVLERADRVTWESPTGPFQRVRALGSFYIGHSEDVAPPSRIADLRLISANENEIIFAWTEPGDNYDAGSVSHYRFWWSSKLECLLTLNLACIEEISPEEPVNPKEASNSLTASLSLPPIYSRVVYYAVTAEDGSGNSSPMSNVVSVVWNVAQSDQSALHESQRRGVWIERIRCSRSSCSSGISLSIVVVCIFAVALIVIIAVIAVCFIERRKKKPKRSRDIILVRQCESEGIMNLQSMRQSQTTSSLHSIPEANSKEDEKKTPDPPREESDKDKSDSAATLPAQPSKGKKESSAMFHPLLGKKGTLFVHRPNCAFSHSDVTQCACNCPFSTVFV